MVALKIVAILDDGWYSWLETRVCVVRFLHTTNPGGHPSEN